MTRRFWKLFYGKLRRPHGHPDDWSPQQFNRYYGGVA